MRVVARHVRNVPSGHPSLIPHPLVAAQPRLAQGMTQDLEGTGLGACDSTGHFEMADLGIGEHFIHCIDGPARDSRSGEQGEPFGARPLAHTDFDEPAKLEAILDSATHVTEARVIAQT